MIDNEQNKMTDSWENKIIDDVLKVKGRIGWKGYKTSDLRESGPIVFSGTEIKSNYHIDLDGVKHLTQEKYDESPEIMLKDKDVLVATRGSLGEIAIYRKEYGPATINPSLVILSEFKGVPEFLYYYLVSKPGQENLLSIASGSSVPAIYQADIRKLEMPFPNFNEQLAIVEVLSSLDDKIDLLHRNNKTLEQIAETLFRQWFVEEANKNMVFKKVKDFGSIVCGKTPSKAQSEYFVGEYSFVKIPDMHGHVFVFETQDSLTEAGFLSQKNKIIPEDSLMVSCIATVGLVSISSTKCQTNQQINSIIPHKKYYLYYLYCYFKHIYDDLLQMASGGSVTQNLNTTDFAEIDVPFLNEEKIVSFHEIVEPLFLKIKGNYNHIITLKASRDNLLPKLMSGQVRVNI